MRTRGGVLKKGKGRSRSTRDIEGGEGQISLLVERMLARGVTRYTGT